MRLLHQAAKQHAAARGEPKGFTATVIKEACSAEFIHTFMQQAAKNNGISVASQIETEHMSTLIICPALLI